MIWNPSIDFKDARLVGGLQSLLNASGSGQLRLEVYDGTITTGSGAPNGNLLVTVKLAPVAFTDHQLVMTQLDPVEGDIIMVTGTATYARMITAANIIVGDGDVTVSSGSGAFKITGTSGTNLLLGGKAFISSAVFT